MHNILGSPRYDELPILSTSYLLRTRRYFQLSRLPPTFFIKTTRIIPQHLLPRY